MSLFEAILCLISLIIISAIVSSAEISLAGARWLKLLIPKASKLTNFWCRYVKTFPSIINRRIKSII